MKPLILLLIVFGATVLIRKMISGTYDFSFAARIAFSAMLLFTALGHFLFPEGMAAMIPSFIPYKVPVVYFTGVLEVAFAIGLVVPSVKLYTAWAIVVFLVLILPANIKAALEHINYQDITVPGPGLMYLWFRIPLQIFFIIWVYLSSIRN